MKHLLAIALALVASDALADEPKISLFIVMDSCGCVVDWCTLTYGAGGLAWRMRVKN